ncbi:MAG TPA: type IV toxin-antitoxin system AbiEi family antitoxin domain-containing protein [Microbacterium sp.]|nr:type IV toxin-antitoxin system AbiEi family antitoxin domain-containing protein [Microbacterium sp.]
MRKRKLDTQLTLLIADVAKHGGVVRSADAFARGHSQRTIAAAIERGALMRIRRVWIARPGADAHLRAAAAAGVFVSCITEARRLGLWVLEDAKACHVAADAHRGRIAVAPGTIIHRNAPIIPRDRSELVDPVENVLANVAACQPLEAAVATWDSALRKRIVTPEALRRLPFTGAARRVLECANPFVDSGLETLVLYRTSRWPVRVLPQVTIAGRDVDFLFGDRLVLQIDGGHHVGAQRTSDIEHDAQLMLMGYHVIRVGYDQVVHDWPSVQAVLMRAIAQGLHEVRDQRRG